MEVLEGVCGVSSRLALGRRIKAFVCSDLRIRQVLSLWVVAMCSSTSKIICSSRLEAIAVRLELVFVKITDPMGWLARGRGCIHEYIHILMKVFLWTIHIHDGPRY